MAREKSSETQRINTAPVDVMGDLNDLNVDDGGSTLDLKSEAKKRAEKNKTDHSLRGKRIPLQFPFLISS